MTIFDTRRVNVWYGLLLVIFGLFIIRLFYIQVIQHNHYQQLALYGNAGFGGQLKEYEIPASRGVIKAHQGEVTVPIVLNEDTYTLFVDPKFVKNVPLTAEQLARVTGSQVRDYEQKMYAKNRYSILAKRLDESKKKRIEKLKLKGIGLRLEPIRAYPQGQLAAQVLGFVNDEGKGNYGVEQFLDIQLRGTPGRMKAVTDVHGIPLASSGDNVLIEPKAGKEVRLTLDLGMQQKVEEILKPHLEEVKSKSGSVIIMDPKTGAVKAMANYPTFNPSQFYTVSDPSVFTNPIVSAPLEVGSIMKVLTMAAGLNESVINPNTTYRDPGSVTINESTLTNLGAYRNPSTRSMLDILKFSLNTGAIYVLEQLGGGQLNEKGRKVWYDYMVNRYQLGRKTGIEQGYEASGTIPSPTDGYALNLQYANTAFGQGTNITMLQMASAFSAAINGGIYYKPHLVESATPTVVKSDVLRPEASAQLRALMESTSKSNYGYSTRPGYSVGGKTGTAQITKPGGGYYEDLYTGTFIGFVGGDMPDYVILVRVNEPNVAGFAGANAAAPLFGKLSNMLMDNFSINQKSQ